MKRAIIVGASSGIGKVLAEHLVKEGYQVGITGRRQEKLLELKTLYPDQIEVSAFDCTSGDNRSKLQALLDQLGGLDLFIVSSGTGDLNPELTYSVEHNTNLLNVNAFTELVTWAFRFFEVQGHGHLVGITSVGGLRGNKIAPAYNASKSFQINYLEGLRQKANEYKNIHVLDFRPGFVDTAMAKGDGIFWVDKKDDVAKKIYRSIQTKKGVGFGSLRWRVLSNVLKIIPRGIYQRM